MRVLTCWSSDFEDRPDAARNRSNRRIHFGQFSGDVKSNSFGPSSGKDAIADLPSDTMYNTQGANQ